MYYFTATRPIQILQQLHGRRKLYYYVVINNEHTHHSYVWIPHVVISWDINCIYIQFDSCSNRRRQCIYLWKNEIGTSTYSISVVFFSCVTIFAKLGKIWSIFNLCQSFFAIFKSFQYKIIQDIITANFCKNQIIAKIIGYTVL